MSNEKTEHDICQSNAQCLHDGLCLGTREIGTFTYCDCRQGFGGARCEDFCPLHCQHGGVCHPTTSTSSPSINDSFQCKCRGHWSGESCDIPYVNCENGSQCYNGGSCSSASNETFDVCDCPSLFTGVYCELPLPSKDSISPVAPTIPDPLLHGKFHPWQNNIVSFSLIAASGGLFLGVGLFSWMRNRERSRIDNNHPAVHYSTVELESHQNVV